MSTHIKPANIPRKEKIDKIKEIKLKEYESSIDRRLKELKQLLKLFPEHKDFEEAIEVVFGRVNKYKEIKESLSIDEKLHYFRTEIKYSFNNAFRIIKAIPPIAPITKILEILNKFEKRIKALEDKLIWVITHRYLSLPERVDSK